MTGTTPKTDDGTDRIAWDWVLSGIVLTLVIVMALRLAGIDQFDLIIGVGAVLSSIVLGANALRSDQ